jgi:hypothetical protein
MPETGMSGLMSGDEKQGGFGQYLRSSSTLLHYARQNFIFSFMSPFGKKHQLILVEGQKTIEDFCRDRAAPRRTE